MAYRDDVIALGPDHGFALDSTPVTDLVGSVVPTSNGLSFTAATPPLTVDATSDISMLTNATADSLDFPSTATINSTAVTQHAVCGWFRVDSIQPPPKRIYGEGDVNPTFQIVLAYGNNVFFEVADPGFNVQVFSERTFTPNRTFHICAIFEGNGFANEARFYIDGIKQTSSDPVSGAPDAADLDARTGASALGDPPGGEGVGGEAVILNASVQGRYAHWYIFNGANAALTDIEVRQELFEKGASPDVTISTDTVANMQIALDALSGTTTNDAPLNILIEPVSGGGDFELNLDNITFNDFASIHVQYSGTDTLDLVNINGSNGSIGSVTGGGSLNFIDPVTVRITAVDASDGSVIQDARLLLEADTGGPLPNGTEILSGLTDVNGVIEDTAFRYSADQPVVGRLRRGTNPIYYRTARISQTITSSGLDITVLMVRDQ